MLKSPSVSRAHHPGETVELKKYTELLQYKSKKDLTVCGNDRSSSGLKSHQSNYPFSFVANGAAWE